MLLIPQKVKLICLIKLLLFIQQKEKYINGRNHYFLNDSILFYEQEEIRKKTFNLKYFFLGKEKENYFQNHQKLTMNIF